jgi:hypothetical protein
MEFDRADRPVSAAVGGKVVRSISPEKATRVFLIVFAIVLWAWLANGQKAQALAGQNDFHAFYIGGRLAGTDQLYDRDAFRDESFRTLGFAMTLGEFVRPPYYATLLKPLAAFDYRVAYMIFTGLSLASLIWFVRRFSREFPELILFAAWSVPAAFALGGGQDAPLLLPIIGGALLLLRSGRPFLAGMLLSLATIKFHLLLGIPIVLLVRREWRMVFGGACGMAALTGFALLTAGRDSFLRYAAALVEGKMHFEATINPNIHGLASVLDAPGYVEVALGLFVVALLAWIAPKIDLQASLALALIGGLLLSYHSGISDAVILYPALAILLPRAASSSTRLFGALAMSPITCLMTMMGAPFSAALPLLMLGILGASAAAHVRLRPFALKLPVFSPSRAS